MKDANRRTLRSVVQYAAAFAAVVPVLVEVLNVDPASVPGGAAVVAAAALITRVMGAEKVNEHMPTWLRKDA